MGKWEDKITRAAHIKKHTRGTSNEISFSVLDAAKNALDGDLDDKQKRAPFSGRIALFTLPSRRKKPAGTPTKERGLHLSTGDFVSVEDSGSISRLNTMSTSRSSPPAANAPAALIPVKPKRSPEEEIARRKARRRLSKALAMSVVVMVTIGLLVAGGSYFYHDFQKQQGYVSELDEALSLVRETDEPLHQLNDVVSDPFREGNAAVRTSFREKVEAVDEQLQQADKRAREVSVDLKTQRDKEAANQTVVTISARRALLEHGQVLMDAADAAEDASKRVDDAWKLVIQSDELARQAAQLITETTAENIEASKDKTDEALSTLDEALAGFVDAQNTYDSADFSPFIDYIHKRQESLEYAIASDEALLEKNKEQATSQNNAYNIADAEAAKLAKALPADPSSLVDETFATVTAEASKAYSTARLQAGAADAFITDYLGTGSK